MGTGTRRPLLLNYIVPTKAPELIKMDFPLDQFRDGVADEMAVVALRLVISATLFYA